MNRGKAIHTHHARVAGMKSVTTASITPEEMAFMVAAKIVVLVKGNS